MKTIFNRGFRNDLNAIILLMLTLCGAACSKQEVPTITSTEQDVVEAVLADNADSPPLSKRGLYNKSSTRLFWGGRDEYSSLTEILRQEASHEKPSFQELVENYVRANATDSKLVFPRKLSDNIILVPPGNNVQAVKDRFTGIEGVYEISRVAIDAQRTTALVSLVYYRGVNAASGRFYIVRFDGQKWIVQKTESFGPRPMT